MYVWAGFRNIWTHGVCLVENDASSENKGLLLTIKVFFVEMVNLETKNGDTNIGWPFSHSREGV